MPESVIVTDSAAGTAATTLQGEARYVSVPSERTVLTGTAAIGKPFSDEATDALRRRLRGEP